MIFDENYIQSSLESSLENSTLMELDLDKIEKFTSKDVLSKYLSLSEDVYKKNNVIYIDTQITKEKLILLNALLFDVDITSSLAHSESIKDGRLSDDDLENIFKWYKNYLSNLKKDKIEILLSLVHGSDSDVLRTLIKLFITLGIDHSKLIVIKNPEKLDTFSLNLINRIFELNEFFNSKEIDVGISFTYLYKKLRKVIKQRNRRSFDNHIMSFTTPSFFPEAQENDNSSIIEEQKKSLSSDSSRIYPVYYGTNRKHNGMNYTNERDDKINYGKCEVNVPKSHKFGSIGSGFFKRLITWDDDRLNIINCSQKDRNGFFEEIKYKIGEDDSLIYIHGYNVSFEEATIRAAQIGFDLKIPMTAFFSWPSKGELKDYVADTATIDASEEYIVEFLKEFIKNINNPNKVHIIVHSMGNRGLLRSFNTIFNQASGSTGIKLGQIFLAAPDVDVDVFKSLADIYPNHSSRTTLYVSQKDKALGASEWLHDFPRAGLLPPVTTLDDIDTIEVTKIDITMLGHSYFGDAKELLYDMSTLIKSNDNPDDRPGLQSIENYWEFH